MRTLGLLFLILSACGGGDSALVLVNDSGAIVSEARLLPAGGSSVDLGENLLEEALGPGSEVELPGVECGSGYEVYLSLSDGRACVVLPDEADCPDLVVTDRLVETCFR